MLHVCTILFIFECLVAGTGRFFPRNTAHASVRYLTTAASGKMTCSNHWTRESWFVFSISGFLIGSIVNTHVGVALILPSIVKSMTHILLFLDALFRWYFHKLKEWKYCSIPLACESLNPTAVDFSNSSTITSG
jgi:hypothetical protein